MDIEWGFHCVFLDSPQFSCDVTTVEVTIGDSLNISCDVRAQPQPTAVTWHFMIGDVMHSVATGDSWQGYSADESVSDTSQMQQKNVDYHEFFRLTLKDIREGQEKTYTLQVEEVTRETFGEFTLEAIQFVENATVKINVTEKIGNKQLTCFL